MMPTSMGDTRHHNSAATGEVKIPTRLVEISFREKAENNFCANSAVIGIRLVRDKSPQAGRDLVHAMSIQRYGDEPERGSGNIYGTYPLFTGILLSKTEPVGTIYPTTINGDHQKSVTATLSQSGPEYILPYWQNLEVRPGCRVGFVIYINRPKDAGPYNVKAKAVFCMHSNAYLSLDACTEENPQSFGPLAAHVHRLVNREKPGSIPDFGTGKSDVTHAIVIYLGVVARTQIIMITRPNRHAALMPETDALQRAGNARLRVNLNYKQGYVNMAGFPLRGTAGSASSSASDDDSGDDSGGDDSDDSSSVHPGAHASDSDDSGAATGIHGSTKSHGGGRSAADLKEALDVADYDVREARARFETASALQTAKAGELREIGTALELARKAKSKDPTNTSLAHREAELSEAHRKADSEHARAADNVHLVKQDVIHAQTVLKGITEEAERIAAETKAPEPQGSAPGQPRVEVYVPPRRPQGGDKRYTELCKALDELGAASVDVQNAVAAKEMCDRELVDATAIANEAEARVKYAESVAVDAQKLNTSGNLAADVYKDDPRTQKDASDFRNGAAIAAEEVDKAKAAASAAQERLRIAKEKAAEADSALKSLSATRGVKERVYNTVKEAAPVASTGAPSTATPAGATPQLQATPITPAAPAAAPAAAPSQAAAPRSDAAGTAAHVIPTADELRAAEQALKQATDAVDYAQRRSQNLADEVRDARNLLTRSKTNADAQKAKMAEADSKLEESRTAVQAATEKANLNPGDKHAQDAAAYATTNLQRATADREAAHSEASRLDAEIAAHESTLRRLSMQMSETIQGRESAMRYKQAAELNLTKLRAAANRATALTLAPQLPRFTASQLDAQQQALSTALPPSGPPSDDESSSKT